MAGQRVPALLTPASVGVGCLLALAACDGSVAPPDIDLVIVTPAPGDSALAGDTVLLSATVLLAGRSSDAAVTWSTAEDGVLGVGNPLATVFLGSGTRVIEAAVDVAGRGSPLATVQFTVLPNGLPWLDSVGVPPRMFDRDTVPLVAFAGDAESEARVVWTVDEVPVDTVASGDTLWWTPGDPDGDRTIVARALDAQGFALDSTRTVSVVDGSRIVWTAMGARRGYRAGVITDWGAITAVGPTGDVAVGFYHGGACHYCLWVFTPSGTVRWQRELDNALGDHSAGLTFGADGSLYAMAFGGWLYGFAADGAQRWRRQGVGNDPHGRFAFDAQGRLIVGANATGGALLARLDPATGDELWRIQLLGAGYLAGPTVLSDGSLAAQLRKLVRADPDGAPLADTVAAPIAAFMSAADARGLHYLAGNPGLIAVNPDNTVRWTVGTNVAEPVIDGDSVAYTATRSVSPSTVMAVGPDGAIRWQTPVTGQSWIPRLAVLADGSVLVATGTFLYRLDRAAGTVLETVQFPMPVQSALAVADDGTIYVVIADGRLLALQGWAPLEPDAPWPIWRRDNARTASVPR